ncbi:hypothetical protein AAF712_010609 [Marasmius tenuissimus]|uniref:Uncharacterized protein n=1 Tax=Marasmius tenuissimus TaxID=585030 RepID=A0ABR2ZMU0_9AGAR
MKRYDISKELPSDEIIAKIFKDGRKVIPILQRHTWEYNSDGEEELVGIIELPEHESFIAPDQPQSAPGGPFDFPPPPEDTYTPSPTSSPAPEGSQNGDEVSEADSQRIIRGPPPRMEPIYPPKGRPRRDARGRVIQGEYETLSENWLEEMLLDFETGRKDLASDLDDLQTLVKDTSFRVLGLVADIKKERKDKQVFLDALEKICGREVMLQVQADALTTARAARGQNTGSQGLPTGFPKGRVRAPVSSKKKSVLGKNPLPVPPTVVGLAGVQSNGKGKGKQADSGKTGHSGRRPPPPNSKRPFQEVDGDEIEGRTPSPASGSSSKRNKRAKQGSGQGKDDGQDKDNHEGSDDNEDDGAPKPGGTGIALPTNTANLKGKRRIEDVEEEARGDDAKSDGSSGGPSTPPKRVRRSSGEEDDNVNDGHSSKPLSTSATNAARISTLANAPVDLPSPTGADAGPATMSRRSLPPPFLWGGHRVDTGVHDIQPVYGPDAHPSRRHLWFAARGGGPSTAGPSRGPAATGTPNAHNASAGPSTAPANPPRRGRPLTRQYNVVFNLDDPAAGSIDLGPVRSPRSRRSGVLPVVAPTGSSSTSNAPQPPPQANQSTASGSGTGSAPSPRRSSRLQARTSAGGSSSTAQPQSPNAPQTIASGSNVTTTPGASTSVTPASLGYPPPPQPTNLSQFFRDAHWTRPPPPPPRNLQRRPLRRENERIVRDPVTNRLVGYNHERDEPDYAAAREAQAAEDIATIRRVTSEAQSLILLEGEPDFVDGDDEEVVLGEHDDLPV